MANLNNEGFAIAPQAECVNSLKPVIWADDGNAESHALRAGTFNCTAPATPPTPTPIASQVDRTAPVLSRVRATRKQVAFRISEAAKVRITIQRRSGRRYKRVKSFTVSVRPGAAIVSFKGRVRASKLRRGRLRITLVATDAAGNRSATVRRSVR